MRIFTKWLMMLGALLTGGIGLVAVYSFAQDRPFSRSDFTAVEGIVHSASEKSEPLKETYLEIYLEERSVRFRVPVNLYRGSFKKDEFRRNIHPGSPIVLEVETTELHNPIIPPRDPKPTVFVLGIRDANTVYYSLDDRREWEHSNRWSSLLVGALFMAGAVVFVLKRKHQFV